MFRSRARVRLAAAVVALTILAPGDVAAAASPARTGDCSLRPNVRASQHSEWLSCLQVGADLDRLPAVGESAELTIVVTAQHARRDVRVEIDLPDNLEWVRRPAGIGVPSPAADQAKVSRAGTILALADAGTWRTRGTVRAIAPGRADIAVRAISPVDLGGPTPTEHIYLTVADRGGASVRGLAASTQAQTVRAPAGLTAQRATPHLRHRAAQPVARHVAPVASLDAGQACVEGIWGYNDNIGGYYTAAPNYGVEVWDTDTYDGVDDYLGGGLTDVDGTYHFCFDNVDNDGGLADGGQDAYVRFVAENVRWRVQDLDSGEAFHYETSPLPNLVTNVSYYFGALVPGDPDQHLGVKAFDAVNDFWKFTPGDCWDAYDLPAACVQMVLNWRWDSTEGTYYQPANHQVYLTAEDPMSRDIVVHEAAHAVMDDVYEFSPVPGAGGGHSMTTAGTPGMAWTEGFADWVPTAVYNEPFFTWPDLGYCNLDTASCSGNVAWHSGANVEGRVAGALLDLADSGVEATWDRLAEGTSNIWTTFLNHKSNTFAEYFNHRALDGFNVLNTGGRACLYQNTIDYVFRDPLSNNAPIQRPRPLLPTPVHNFSYNTTTQFWSVVALRPVAGADYDLKLYDDVGQATQLSQSILAGSVVDFVAVNSNSGKRPLGDYYPRVIVSSGTGDYALELAQGAIPVAANAAQNIPMWLAKVVAVRDTVLTAGVPVTIKITPGSATQDVELFVVGSTTGVPATFIRARVAATRSATSGGPGAVETITFTPSNSGVYGVIVVNKSGNGTVKLERLG